MILVDFNQVVISNFMIQVGAHTNIPLDESMLRHMILNAIRSYRQKFVDEFGELVICCDSKRYWRKDVFPFYKAGRKKDRQSSGVDWNTMFTTLNKVRQELMDVFPYKTILIDGAEADDIIGCIARNVTNEKILILSSDKDFIQLHINPNVKQYSPVLKKFVRHEHPEIYLKEHIVKGDRGDGIPNINSPDGVFVDGGRQKPVRKKILEELTCLDIDMIENSEHLEKDMLKRNWMRNRQLIDLTVIPEDIENSIMSSYNNYEMNDRSGLFNFFIEKRLNNLMESIGEF
tara:strand:- start:982 stop:1845 length:864 start_codon:yes stop_codon:yes gene_type:complete